MTTCIIASSTVELRRVGRCELAITVSSGRCGDGRRGRSEKGVYTRRVSPIAEYIHVLGSPACKNEVISKTGSTSLETYGEDVGNIFVPLSLLTLHGNRCDDDVTMRSSTTRRQSYARSR